MNHPSNSVLNVAIGALSRTMAALVAILFFLVSCSNAPGGAQKTPQSQGPGEQTSDQVQPVSGDASSDDAVAKSSEEYGSLPRQVVIGVAVDGDGRDVAGSGEMRIPAQDAQASDEIASDEAAHQAFESGQPAHVVADGDELDQDSSTQSWASPLQASDYGSYQPRAYSRWNAGGAYTYGEGRRYVYGSRAYYVYLRPVCPWVRCAPQNGPGNGPGNDNGLDATLRAALQAKQIAPLADNEWMSATNEQVELGARLFNDRLLSARGDIACATCHIDAMGTSDNLSVGITGDVISRRKVAPFSRSDLLGRNVPGLFNLGHKSYDAMFWDARVRRSQSHASGFITPAGNQTPVGLNSVLAAQALFPLLGLAEMGASGIQEDGNPTQGWKNIMSRVLARQDYALMFKMAFPTVTQPTIAHLGNAIAAFESRRWRADGAPFDRYLKGDGNALSANQKQGALLFYGKANCGSCHAGPLQTDQRAHAIAIPQWGPGAGQGASGLEDFGVGGANGNAQDRYKFRTPSLRNVAQTGPWGHNGAFRSLRQFVIHYTNPQQSHDRWQPSQIVLPSGFNLNDNILGAWTRPASRDGVRNASEIQGVSLTAAEIDRLVDFLQSLTDSRVAKNSQSNIVNPQ